MIVCFRRKSWRPAGALLRPDRAIARSTVPWNSFEPSLPEQHWLVIAASSLWAAMNATMSSICSSAAGSESERSGHQTRLRLDCTGLKESGIRTQAIPFNRLAPLKLNRRERLEKCLAGCQGRNPQLPDHGRLK